ncbi:MAG: DUF2029 domain-containing protein, partial [Ktedonobacterales bacterium]|nr:DUF2029 domain-containing protein [Ktedonobacterales bacterium]
MRLASPVALPRWHGSMRVRFALAIAGVVTLQLGVLAAMRFLTSPDGGDICRDIVAVHRMLAGQNPYMRITECGVLFNLPHPPAYLLLISPFTLLPLPWAAVVWNLATLVALAAGLALTARELGLAPTAPWRLGALLALGVFWPPLLGALLEAQISPLLLLLVILAWRAARRGQLSWAGAALGIAGALRLFPLLAVGYFALRREWRAVFAAAGAFAAVSLLPLPLISPAGYIAFATREAPASTAFWITHEHN